MSPGERHVLITLSIFVITITSTFSFPAKSGARGYDEVPEFETDSEIVPDDAMQEYYNYIPLLYKRGPQLSVNQDLMSIASMLRNEAGRRKMEAAQDFLTRIGKRSYPSESELNSPSRFILSNQPFQRPTRGRDETE